MRSEQILPIGTLLQGRYKIEKVRGKGGFGITYCAMDLKMHARVAIKACVREQEQAARRVQNEATIMGPLRGLDSIVIVVDYFMENSVYYIVMEYIHGTTVKKYIQENGTMKGDEVLERMRPVLQAMEQIHKKGIIHRDISPNNLMITKDHKLKLIDYGEAIKVESGSEHSVLKNAGYSAIEQSSPQGELGPWTDIYALWITGSCLVIIVSFVLILAGLESMGSDSGSSGVVSSSDLMQAKEQSRIATAIQENKLDNVLNEIDELYPPDSDLSDADKQNRFVLLLNYYMKKGDLVKEKDLLDSVVTTGESAKYDRVFQDLIKEEQKKLATATAAPTARTKK